MRLLELELENFRQYARAAVAFETGITAIVGANGAGKTTLVEAILWALYGANAARGTADTLRFMWSQGGTRVQVRLDFQLGARLYQVVRTDKDAVLTQIQNGVHQTLARGTRPTTEAILNLLGMTLNQFQTSFCARQKELEFMSYAPERRREEISRMLGYERITKAIDEIAQRAKQLGAEIEGLQQGLGDRELVQQQIEQTRQTLASCERDIARIEAQLITARAEYEQLAQQRREAELKKHIHDDLQNRLRQLQNQQTSIDERLEQLRTRWNQIQQARKRLQELRADLERYREVQRRLKELNELAQAEQQRAALTAAIEQLLSHIERLQSQLQQLEQKAHQLQQLEPVIQQANQIQAELSALRQQAARAAERARLENELATLQSRLDTLQQRQQQAESLQAQIAQLESQMSEREAQRDELQRQIDQLSQQWRQQRTDAESQLKLLQSRLQELQQRLDELHALGEASECPTCGQPLGDAYQRICHELEQHLRSEQDAYQCQLARCQSLEQEPELLQAYRAQLQQVMAERDSLQQQLAELRARHDQIQAELAEQPTLQRQCRELQRRIEAIPLYDPQREQALNEQLQQLQPQLELANELSIQLKEQPRLQNELEGRQDELRKLQQQLASLPEGYNPIEHETLRTEAEQLQPLYEEAIQLNTILKEEAPTREQIEQARREQEEVQAQLERTQQELQALAFSPGAYEQALERCASAEAQLRELENQLASLQATRQSHQQHLQMLEQQLQQIQEREELLKRRRGEQLLYETVRKAMQAFRTELNQRLRPMLASYATEFLTHLTGGRYTQLELDEEYRFHLMDDGMRKAVISGGEQDIVNLCMRLALARLITERAGQPLSLLILDEVFGSLDTDRRQNVLMLLNNLRDWFEQILIISHIEEINEAADRTLYVVRDERTRASTILTRTADPLSDLALTDPDA